MHWYNPKTRRVEDVSTPLADEDALEILSGDPTSRDFIREYVDLRDEGMGVGQAMIFVGHEFRLRHLRGQPIGQRV